MLYLNFIGASKRDIGISNFCSNIDYREQIIRSPMLYNILFKILEKLDFFYEVFNSDHCHFLDITKNSKPVSDFFIAAKYYQAG